MKLHAKPLAVAVVVMTALSGFQIPQAAAEKHGGEMKKEEMTAVEKGKKVAENKTKGNCMACHQFAGAKLPGNIGPPLVAIKARFPDKQKLRDLIWDMTARNPNTAMPPFGKYKILKDEDIDNIAEWVYTL
jgi:sulfur-oxidizing protein SoxX